MRGSMVLLTNWMNIHIKYEELRYVWAKRENTFDIYIQYKTLELPCLELFHPAGA